MLLLQLLGKVFNKFHVIAVATPKQIREVMQVDGLTNDEVKSHLQVSNDPLCPGIFLVVQMPISGDIVSCLETYSIVSCSYSEVPAAQQKIPRCGSGEPADHAGGWPLGSSGAKQLRVSPGSASVLRIRCGHLYGHRRRRRQQQQRRRQQVRRLQPEMSVRLRLICGRSSDESVEIASRLCLRIGGNNRTDSSVCERL